MHWTSGSNNVPINVPVTLRVAVANPAGAGKPSWSPTAPAGSKAAIAGGLTARFTPDVAGVYMVGVRITVPPGRSNTDNVLTTAAGTFIGVDDGACRTCHPGPTAEWSRTGHASILEDNLDNARTPDVYFYYGEGCVRRHGGHSSCRATAGSRMRERGPVWTLPSLRRIDAAGRKTGADNFASAPAPIDVATSSARTAMAPPASTSGTARRRWMCPFETTRATRVLCGRRRAHQGD